MPARVDIRVPREVVRFAALVLAVTLALCAFGTTAAYAAPMESDSAMTIDCSDRTSASVPDALSDLFGSFVAASPFVLPEESPDVLGHVAFTVSDNSPSSLTGPPLRI